ncbi:MAG TPA: hypothetical protein VLD67_06850, partial [Vicinamibacterales bacterium]|nr:hypothetical protein [Vicinamibacterales bacterium]
MLAGSCEFRLVLTLALFQPDFPEHGETRTAGKAGPPWLHGEKRQEQVARVDGLFEPVERLLVLPQGEMDEREVRRRYVRLRGPCL